MRTGGLSRPISHPRPPSLDVSPSPTQDNIYIYGRGYKGEHPSLTITARTAYVCVCVWLYMRAAHPSPRCPGAGPAVIVPVVRAQFISDGSVQSSAGEGRVCVDTRGRENVSCVETPLIKSNREHLRDGRGLIA